MLASQTEGVNQTKTRCASQSGDDTIAQRNLTSGRQAALRCIPLAAAALLMFSAARAEDAAPVDLLAFSNGALIERTSAPYDDSWHGIWLLDEDVHTGWANDVSIKPPFEIIISVPDQSRFTRFVFDTASVETPERAAKDIDIFISDQSTPAGFTNVMSVKLGPASDGQGFDAPPGTVGRWLKFVLKSNYGDAQYVEVMNLHGFGVPIAVSPLPSVSGTYESEAYGKFHLAQSGAQLTGCYEYKGGLVQGGLEAHLMRLTWSEENGAKSGPAVMVATRDGRGFHGLWRLDGPGEGWHDNWLLRKISNDVGSCPHWRPVGAKTNMLADSLSQQGRVRLYGINFDTDSDRLRPDATPTLDQLAAALKGNAAWRIMVEGHTDSTSTPAHNKDLSARRAAAVKTYLVTAGIPAARLETSGFGQDKPLAPNDTALGRSQNRRVEVVRE